MKVKLLGAFSAAVLLCSISVANAQGPMQLTDNQLDGLTAGTNFASVSAFVVNATTVAGTTAFALFANPTASSAAIAGSFVRVGNNLPHLAGVSAFAN